MGKEIFVICDTEKHDSEHVLQMVSKARILADECGMKVSVIGIGTFLQESADRLCQYGAERFVICSNVKVTSVRMFCDIMETIMKREMPELVLFPASPFGKAVAAVLSTRFEAGLTADCIDLAIENGTEFSFSRAAINDSVVAKIKCVNCQIQMATIKKDVFLKNQYTKALQFEIEQFKYQQENIVSDKWEVIGTERNKVIPEIDINQYSIVFCIGRGVRNEKTKKLIFQLADSLGAGVIGTRAAVEEQMIVKERQVGQSGKSISPKIYVGFGVSGASQHMVGIKNAKTIIAVNQDEHAPIFNYADYSIVEDVDEFVMALKQLL